MRYRALVATFTAIGVALLLLILWALAMRPMLLEATNGPTTQAPEARQVRLIFTGTLLLGLILISLILVMGFKAAVREWLRRLDQPRRRQRTRYIDAWKVAGQRMATPPDESTHQ